MTGQHFVLARETKYSHSQRVIMLYQIQSCWLNLYVYVYLPSPPLPPPPVLWRRGGQLQMLSTAADLSPSLSHCVVLLGKTFYSNIASLHTGDKWVPAIYYWGRGVTPRWTGIPSRGEQNDSYSLHATEIWISSGCMGRSSDVDVTLPQLPTRVYQGYILTRVRSLREKATVWDFPVKNEL